MRKGHLQVIEKAKENKFPTELVSYLTECTEVTLAVLDIIYWYFWGHFRLESPDALIKEVKRCIAILHTCSQSTFLYVLRHYLLDAFYKHNPLFEDTIKEQLINKLTDSKYSFIIFEAKYRMCQCIVDQNIRSQFLQDISTIANSKKLTNIRFFFLLLLNEKEAYDFILQDLNKNATDSIFYKIVKEEIWKLLEDYNLRKRIHSLAQKRSLRENLCIDDCLIDDQLVPELLFYTREEYQGLLNQYKHIEQIFLEDDTVIRYDSKIQPFMDAVSKDIPGCILDNPSYYYRSKKNKESGFVNIKLQHSNKTKIRLTVDGVKIYPCTERYEDLSISPDGNLLTNDRKIYPLSLKKAHYLMNQNPIFKEKMEKYFMFCVGNNLFVRDILSDCKKGCLLPIKVSDIFQYHNRREYIEKNFKTASGIKINWNKYNLNLSYLLIKSLPYVEKESRNILLSAITSLSYDEIALVCKETNTVKTNVCNFLEQIIIKKCSLNAADEKEMQMVRDYVSMCVNDKVGKLYLSMNTCSGLLKKHDVLSQKMYEQRVPKVVIPKKSKFLGLRKILPKKYEWVRSKKRLIKEADMQQHCVWSYADKINSDQCAIYSYMDDSGEFSNDGKPHRYTIEFVYNFKNNKYYIRQVQGRYNQLDTLCIQNHLKKLLAG